ncbi:MAG: hypothetical protein MUO64_02760 [Anaerolineales bacterium]|nr:hypothetical protein [Anaerolineales bacterium]
MGERQVVESYARQVATFRPMAEQVRSSARSRLVWFVALSGFVILNGKALWDPIAQVSFTGLPLALLVCPWVIAALAAVVTHFMIDEAGVKDDIYATKKAASIDLYLESLDEGDADPREMVAIINDSRDDLKEPKRVSERYGYLAQRLERITFLIIVVGFVWSFIGPFILARCTTPISP